MLTKECRTRRELLLCKAGFLIAIFFFFNLLLKLFIFFPGSIEDFLPVLILGCPEAIVLWYQISFQPSFTVMLEVVQSCQPGQVILTLLDNAQQK